MTIGDWNEFRTYIYCNGLGVKKGEKLLGRKPTHLLLDGGRVIVPPEREQEFLEKYAVAFGKGLDLFVVEMKSDPCFFFMSEFDMKFPLEKPMNQEQLYSFVRVVQSVMFQAFPDFDVTAGVSTAPIAETHTTDGRPALKCGVHVNWRVPVNLETAWILRAWILRELSTRLVDDFPQMEAWTEAYDPCILLDNGLRMIGSKKATPCDVCKGESCYKRGKKTTLVGPNNGKIIC